MVEHKAVNLLVVSVGVLLFCSHTSSQQIPQQRQQQQQQQLQQQQQQQQGQHAECRLVLQGVTASSSNATTSGLHIANIACSVTGGPIPIAVHPQYVQRFAPTFIGVTIVNISACNSSTHAAPPAIPALLYFCGDYQVRLIQPEVTNVLLPPATQSGPYGTALLGFGGEVVASISRGGFIGNAAGPAVAVVQEASLAVDKTVFANSTGTAAVAAVALGNASVTITASKFSNISASQQGGAILASDYSSASVSSSNFTNITAAAGAAVLAERNSSVSIDTSNFSSNAAVQNAAGVLATNGAEVLIEDCKFTANEAGNAAGAILASDDSTTKIRSSRFDGNSAMYGGAVTAWDNAALEMKNCVFSNSTAKQNGGAVVMAQTSQASLLNCTFNGNSAGNLGGAAFLADKSNVTARNCTFNSNTARYGAGVGAYDGSSASFVGSNFTNNSAGSNGGGLAAGNTAKTSVQGCRFGANQASSGAGLLVADAARATIRDSQFEGNQATYGGGVAVYSNATATFNSTVLTNNSATLYGGGLSAGGEAQVSLNSATVTANSASKGGGIYAFDSAQLTLSNSTVIQGNTALDSGGGLWLGTAAFDPKTVPSAAHGNTAQFGSDVSVAPTSIRVASDLTVEGSTSPSASDNGILSVTVNVSGTNGLPADGAIIAATLANGTLIGIGSSGQDGVANMLLKPRLPPARYDVSFSLINHPEVPAESVSLQVRGCSKGEVSPSPGLCLPCPPGLYSLSPNSTRCDRCPENAACPGGAVIVPDTGYWHSAAASAQIHRCPNPQACQGVKETLQECGRTGQCHGSDGYANLQCSHEYTGNLCGECSAGYGAIQPFTCEACMPFAATVALFAVSAVFLFVLIKVLCHLVRSESDVRASLGGTPQVPGVSSSASRAELLRVLVLYGQWMLLVAAMNISWPVTLAYPFKVLGWFWAPVFPQLITLDCMLPADSAVPVAVLEIIIYLGLPIAMLALLVLLDVVWNTLLHRSSTAPGLLDCLANDALIVVFFFLPAILRVAFGLFLCIPLDTAAQPPHIANAVGSYWGYDMSTECFEGYHFGLSLGLGIPLILLFCFGLPGFIMHKSLASRSSLNDALFRQHYGFITNPYAPSRSWWEALVVLQTAVLVAVSVYGINTGSVYQGLMMVAAFMLISHLILAFKPYAHSGLRRAMLQGLFCLSLTSLVGLSFMSYSSASPGSVYGTVMGAIILAVNVLYVASLCWKLLMTFEWHHCSSKLRRVRSTLIHRVDSMLHPEVYANEQKHDPEHGHRRSLELLRRSVHMHFDHILHRSNTTGNMMRQDTKNAASNQEHSVERTTTM